MKKAVFIIVLAMVVMTAWAGTEYRNACRQIIYAVNPVDEIANLSDARLVVLYRFALGIPVEGQNPLNENDALLFTFLADLEFARREMSANEFSLRLQEERELLQPLMRGSGDVTIFIKMNSWIDLYRLRLIAQ